MVKINFTQTDCRKDSEWIEYAIIVTSWSLFPVEFTLVSGEKFSDNVLIIKHQ